MVFSEYTNAYVRFNFIIIWFSRFKKIKKFNLYLYGVKDPKKETSTTDYGKKYIELNAHYKKYQEYINALAVYKRKKQKYDYMIKL